MKNRLKIFLIAAVSTISTPLAFAADDFIEYEEYPEISICEEYPDPFCDFCKKWYITASGSVGWHNQTEMSDPYNNVTLIADSRTNWGLNFALGRYFAPWRLELEFSYKNNPTDSFHANGSISSSSVFSLKYRTLSLMANGYYDFCLTDRINFYLGAGMGVAFNRWDLRIKDPNFTGSLAYARQYLFAAQGLTGISYALSNSIDMTLGYRLFVTTKPWRVENIPVSNNIDIGVRYKF